MKKLVYILLIILIIALISIIFMFQINKEKTNTTIAEDKFITPDRIIYKNDQSNYYIFEKNQENFAEIFAKVSNGVGTFLDGEMLEETKINEIKNRGAFIEFDYNTVSKNFIILLNEENIGVIKMLESNGQVQTSTLKDKDKIKKYLDDVTKYQTSLEFTECKNYESTKTLPYEEIADLSGFEQKDTYHYQRKFTTSDEFSSTLEKLYFAPKEEKSRTALQNKIDFEKQNAIITISQHTIKDVKQNVGNIRFTYDNTVYNNYTVNLTVVSKVANINCIYNEIDGVSQYVAPPSPSTPEEIEKNKEKAKKEIEGYLLDGYRVDIGAISEVNVDSEGNGYIIVDCSVGTEYSYPVKLKVNSQTETFLGMGMHLQSNYGYQPHEICDITLDTKITDIDNIQGYVKMIEYIAD